MARETIPEQMTLPDGSVFPLVYSPPASNQLQWAKDNRLELAQELKQHGAILFRGFDLHSAEDFQNFVEALGVKPLPYIGGAAVRHTVYKDVHTTNESPPDQPIPFHHEMAQVPKYPECLFFYCFVAPTSGGETPILSSHLIYQKALEKVPQFCRDLEEKGVIYLRTIPEKDDNDSPVGRGWVNTFQSADRAEVEKSAKNLNVTMNWLPDGSVTTVSPVLQAIKTPPKLGKKVWFNSVIAAYKGCVDKRNDPRKAVTYGDGSFLNHEDVEAVVQLMEENCVSIPWVKGDLIWIDNNQVLHSRKFFTPPRRIFAYLGENCPY